MKADKIYTKLPYMECKGLCQKLCGPILMARGELERIEAHVGEIPRMGESLVCPLLRNGRCTVYDIRPLICRLWGLVRKMRCPYGCRPKKWVSDKKAGKLLTWIEKEYGPVVAMFDVDTWGVAQW